MLEIVVLIHGIWMTGADMLLLSKRVNECGYDPYIFHYQSIDFTPAQNAQRLNVYLHDFKQKKINFVSHSLGGVVLMEYLSKAEKQKPGRVVLLGSPINGSHVAKNAQNTPTFKMLMGKAEEGLVKKSPKWKGNREVGMIAGNAKLPIGIGRITGGLEKENDGVVSLSETQYEGLKSHLTMDVSHSELLFSVDVAENICSFLKKGQFGHYKFDEKKQGFETWLPFFENLFDKIKSN